jgi:hypothetical protein
MITLLSAAVSGCSDLERQVMLDKRIVNVVSKTPINTHDTGVAFLSLGSADKTCSSGVFDIFFAPADPTLPEMSFDAVTANISGVSNAVMKTPSACIELIGMGLPPGRYQISGWKWSFDAGTQTQRLTSDQPLHVPFDVKAGEVTYLGSFQMRFQYGKNFIGRPVLAGGSYGVKNESERDRKKLYEMRPELATLPVVEQLPPDDEGPAGFARIVAKDGASRLAGR